MLEAQSGPGTKRPPQWAGVGKLWEPFQALSQSASQTYCTPSLRSLRTGSAACFAGLPRRGGEHAPRALRRGVRPRRGTRPGRRDHPIRTGRPPRPALARVRLGSLVPALGSGSWASDLAVPRRPLVVGLSVLLGLRGCPNRTEIYCASKSLLGLRGLKNAGKRLLTGTLQIMSSVNTSSRIVSTARLRP